MPQNPIQFQQGMSLNEFMTRYGTEEQCEAALERARWPGGFVCAQCGAHRHGAFAVGRRRYWECAHCHAQTTLRSGTLFHASKLPLIVWFQAIYRVTQNKNNLSALSLKPHLGICDRSAWRLKHKLMEAMAEREAPPGGWTAPTSAASAPASPGAVLRTRCRLSPPSSSTRRGHPQRVRLDPIPDLKAASVRAWARGALAPSAHLVTDGPSSFAAAGEEVAQYGAIIVSPRKSSARSPFRWVNTFISNAKTAIRGTCHHFDFAKYRRRYLAQAQYRINRRFDLASLVGRLIWASARTAPCPERWLRLAEVRGNWE